MDFPPLKVFARDREFKLYTREQREEAVIRFMFDGADYRKIDCEVLELDSKVSNGFQSHGILHHYGLTAAHQGIFKGMSYQEAAESIPDVMDFDFIHAIVMNRACEREYPISPVEEEYGIETMRIVKVRANQDKFRSRVLAAYGRKCCITGITEPRLLRASHIKPWCRSSPVEKLDVRNGLCLNALHDAAFDTGLMTVDPDSLEIVLSDRLEGIVEDDVIERYFGNYEGMEIRCPNPEAGPLPEYLRYHRDNVFDRVDPDHVRTVLELRAEDMSPTVG